MTKVHLLPPDVISKIAAGEVIERPASVIKELMENALDARSKSIEITLKDAGKTSIEIKDTGHGIAKDDLETIFLRHATSKIQTADDLFDINSLGFRGEALYSLAAIADITLRSKTKDEDSGWEIHLRGGKTLNLHPVTMAHTGTEIEIRELFYNTPARKKFLKSNTTEIHQILNTFIPYTLLYPEIRFLLKHQNKTLLDLNPAPDFIPRISKTMNLDSKYILDGKENLSEKNITIHMILGDNNITRAKRDMQFLFINNRPVQNKNISFHINQIYRLILPPQVFSFFAIYIQLPNEDIDVNIHPAKREVKLKNEQTVCSILRALCERTLMTAQGKQVVAQEETSNHTTCPKPQSTTHTYKAKSETFPSYAHTALREPTSIVQNYNSTQTQPHKKTKSEELFIPSPPENLFTQKQDTLQSKLSRAFYIGSFMNKYLFFEGNPTNEGEEKSLFLIDQHAAAERISFEKIIAQMQKGEIETQQLLSPILIKLSSQELLIWEESIEKLKELGLETNLWDNETIALHTHPNLLKNPEQSIRQLLAGENIARCDHETLARRACRSSVMTGDHLNQQKAEYLRAQLTQCKDPFTCPHGRPTVIEMSENFLNKQFLRN